MLDKIKKLIEDRDLTTYEIVHNTGVASRTNILEPVLEGKKELTSTNFNSLSAIARGLGVTLEEILEDYDLDGTSSQILNIERTVKRIIKSHNHGKVFTQNDNGGYVIGVNYPNSNLNDFPILKTDFDFIDSDKLHAEQKTEPIHLLNRKWIDRSKKSYLTKNETLTNLAPRFNKYSMSFLIYSPIYKDSELIGGDFKLAITVTDKKGMFFFSEVYGCEWLNTDKTKHITYYKTYDDHYCITPKRIQRWNKWEISELEFWKALYSQYFKFGISK